MDLLQPRASVTKTIGLNLALQHLVLSPDFVYPIMLQLRSEPDTFFGTVLKLLIVSGWMTSHLMIVSSSWRLFLRLVRLYQAQCAFHNIK